MGIFKFGPDPELVKLSDEELAEELEWQIQCLREWSGHLKNQKFYNEKGQQFTNPTECRFFIKYHSDEIKKLGEETDRRGRRR